MRARSSSDADCPRTETFLCQKKWNFDMCFGLEALLQKQLVYPRTAGFYDPRRQKGGKGLLPRLACLNNSLPKS
jgi:hypothetical protein